MSLIVKNSPYILGIDLGTSNSAVSVFVRQNADILPVDGHKTCPSVVNMKDDGEFLVGKAAKNKMMIEPDNTVASVKRQMGTEWNKEFKNCPGKVYTPEDISAEILAKLVSAVQQNEKIDLRGTPKYAVICIPANFTDAQKTATKKAAELANLEALYLLEEPVAAAIAYAMDRERDQTVLVYDLGGGTFDVSILQVDSSGGGAAQFKVLAKAGVSQLGGDDFDWEIVKLINKQVMEQSNLDLLDLKKEQGINKKQLRTAQQKMKEKAEEAKCNLTELQSTEIILPNLIKDESGKQYSVNMEITREQFNDSIRELVLQSKEAVERALAEAKLTIEDISRILLVGGSTRVPLVRTMLTEMFDREPYSDTDPDIVIARGAAIFGASLGVPADKTEDTSEANPEDQPKNEICITNIVTHYLGIETHGGKFSGLIDKGMEIPADSPLSASKEYTTHYDNMTDLTIRVFQSELPAKFTSDESVQCIGEFFLTGIQPKAKGQERITVTFSIDQQNMLKVEASSSTSSGALDIQRS